MNFAAGGLYAGEAVAMETVVLSPTQLNGRASGDCQSIIRDDALIGSLMDLYDKLPETLPYMLTPCQTLPFPLCLGLLPLFHAEAGRVFLNESTLTHKEGSYMCNRQK